jgi:ADP-dependent phosphofructokinase/glucokinase
MRLLCAYNVNIDAVHNVSGEIISELISNSASIIRTKMPETIRTSEDFFSGLLTCMKKGIGAELIVESQDVASFIEKSFSWEYRMGGNTGNIVNALAELGAEPVANVPSMSFKQAQLFSPEVKIPVFINDELRLSAPEDAAKDEDDLIHFVLQFDGNETVETSDEKIITPRENRFIATFDVMNSLLHANPAFDAYSEKCLDEVDGAIISGLHLAPMRTPDGRGYKELFSAKIEKMNEWKRRRPELYIHVELGNFRTSEIMRYAVDKLAVDSIGMNEDELAILEMSQPQWRNIIDSARRLRARLKIPRLCIHTREYIISVMQNLIDPLKEVDALTYGADVAASLVATGSIMRLPKTDDLEVSAIGAQAKDDFCEDYGGVSVGRGAYARFEGDIICLVPSLIAARPLVTVGIGDAMTAAAYYREVKALVEAHS